MPVTSAERTNRGTCPLPLPPTPANAAVLGKAEGLSKNWHGHVTAVTVAPTYRRQRLAEKLMGLLEDITTQM